MSEPSRGEQKKAKAQRHLEPEQHRRIGGEHEYLLER
jgi:hypothetical protein